MAENEITRSIIIKGSPDQLYEIWSDYEKHPLFSESLKEVRVLDEKVTRWVMDGPLGKEIKWTAEMTRDDEGRRIGWRTIEGDVTNSGQITFSELPNNETQVVVQMRYDPPGGKLGDIGAKVLDNPAERVEKDLKAFKTYVEQKTSRAASRPNK